MSSKILKFLLPSYLLGEKFDFQNGCDIKLLFWRYQYNLSPVHQNTRLFIVHFQNGHRLKCVSLNILETVNFTHKLQDKKLYCFHSKHDYIFIFIEDKARMTDLLIKQKINTFFR